MSVSWLPPKDYAKRPVAVLGAGVLGRRIGCVWAAAGYAVHLRDPSSEQLSAGIAYIQEHVSAYAAQTSCVSGQVQAFELLKDAVRNAWLVIEAVPEKLALKIDTMAELEMHAPPDCILASNSSSFRSSEMLEKVTDAAKCRILNMHYYMPPDCMVVELMTSGVTSEGIFPFMVDRCHESATMPFVARKQSTGIIFNRLWAAVKREILTILSEGVSVPEEIDSMWDEMFIRRGTLPCKLMDGVGLDTVALIEQHYVNERGISAQHTVDYLKANYVDKGKLGNKCALGGLYPPAPSSNEGGRLLVLDIGLASLSAAADISKPAGQILSFTPDGRDHTVLISDQLLPDGITVDPVTQRIFWTCMGIPGKRQGAIYSAAADGSDIQTVLHPGVTNTPKQITIDPVSRKLYFCDREGGAVYQCNLDGRDLKALVSRPLGKDGRTDVENWCIGIAVSRRFNKFYWTQKGASKGGRGRIFSAPLDAPPGRMTAYQDNQFCIFKDWPEPIDLELDEDRQELYWTDRGEIPMGNALYRSKLDDQGRPVGGVEVLVRGLHEAIGVSIDRKTGSIYLTDLGGAVYKCDRNGERKKVFFQEDRRAFTGVIYT